jgi:hypothetical protein
MPTTLLLFSLFFLVHQTNLNYITFRPDLVSASSDVTSILRIYYSKNPTTYFINTNDIPDYTTKFLTAFGPRLSEKRIDRLDVALRPLAQSPKTTEAFILISLPSSLHGVENLTTEGLAMM